LKRARNKIGGHPTISLTEGDRAGQDGPARETKLKF
jgi:hypothetical protein